MSRPVGLVVQQRSLTHHSISANCENRDNAAVLDVLDQTIDDIRICNVIPQVEKIVGWQRLSEPQQSVAIRAGHQPQIKI